MAAQQQTLLPPAAAPEAAAAPPGGDGGHFMLRCGSLLMSAEVGAHAAVLVKLCQPRYFMTASYETGHGVARTAY